MRVVCKIVHKASAWSKHGKKRDRLSRCIISNKLASERRELIRKRAEPKFDTVEAAFLFYSRRR